MENSLHVAACLAASLFLWGCNGAQEELASLPPAERAALLSRTLETLRTTCPVAPGPVVEAHCRAASDLALSFPECDEACRALALRFRPQPSR